MKQKAHQLAKKVIKRALQIWAEPIKKDLPGRTKAQLLKQGPIKNVMIKQGKQTEGKSPYFMTPKQIAGIIKSSG